MPPAEINRPSSAARIALWGLAATVATCLFLPAADRELQAIEPFVLFHVLCLTPLLLAEASRLRSSSRALEHAAWLQPWAALLTAASALVAGPVIAAVLCLGWLLVAVLAAAAALAWLRSLPRRPAELAVAFSLLFLLAGALWLLLSRLEVVFLGLSREQIKLAVVHSHYTGFAGLMLVALPANQQPRRIDGWLVAGMVLGFALTAVGIAFSPPVELAGATVLLVIFTVLAVRQLFLMRRHRTTGGQLLLLVSSGSLLAALGLAGAHAVRHLAGEKLIQRLDLIWFHGGLLALGFVGCALLFWRRHPEG